MTFTKPDFVRKNISQLLTLRTTRGLMHCDLSKAVGIPEHLLKDYEAGYRFPIRGNYNRLANYFGWKVWKL